MFKHILIPTDGSNLSKKAVKAGVRFAKSMSARVTGFHSYPSFQQYAFSGYDAPEAETVKHFDEKMREAGEKYLTEIEKEAKAAGVDYTGVVQKADAPYLGITEAAKKRGCDAIFMASHGRKGIAALLVGSETQKVLTHSKIPVVVFR
ncbi:MAG TPA: universal stress protein [Burkholderiales bacterium]|nr:universal stress protein [Burkholderiales bacterium]